MTLLDRAETITVDDLTFSVQAKRLSWEPSVPAHDALWKIEKSLTVLIARCEKLGALRELMQVYAKRAKGKEQAGETGE